MSNLTPHRGSAGYDSNAGAAGWDRSTDEGSLNPRARPGAWVWGPVCDPSCKWPRQPNHGPTGRETLSITTAFPAGFLVTRLHRASVWITQATRGHRAGDREGRGVLPTVPPHLPQTVTPEAACIRHYTRVCNTATVKNSILTYLHMGGPRRMGLLLLSTLASFLYH